MTTIIENQECMLENWGISTVNIVNDQFLPEIMTYRLTGNVYGNSKFQDGTHVTTSIVQEKIGSKKFRTKNSIYVLGEIDCLCFDWFKQKGLTIVCFKLKQICTKLLFFPFFLFIFINE